MNLVERNIKDIAEEVVERNNLLLIDVTFRGNERSKVIEVFVDGERDISAEDCAKTSKEINKLIEDRDIVKSSYRLDVSTPGVDRSLKYLEQYYKHLNRKFRLKFKSGDETDSAEAKLIKIDKEYLYFYSGGEIIIDFKDIIEAKVLVSFN